MTQLATVIDVIDAPADAVWAVLADFAHPQRLAPTIDRCTTSGRGVGAIRIVESSRGLTIHERLLESDSAAYRFRYEVLDSGDMPFAGVTSYACTVTLSHLPGGATGIEWSSTGTIDGPHAPIADFLATLYHRATDRIRTLTVHRR